MRIIEEQISRSTENTMTPVCSIIFFLPYWWKSVNKDTSHCAWQKLSVMHTALQAGINREDRFSDLRCFTYRQQLDVCINVSKFAHFAGGSIFQQAVARVITWKPLSATCESDTSIQLLLELCDYYYVEFAKKRSSTEVPSKLLFLFRLILLILIATVFYFNCLFYYLFHFRILL